MPSLFLFVQDQDCWNHPADKGGSVTFNVPPDTCALGRLPRRSAHSPSAVLSRAISAVRGESLLLKSANTVSPS